MIWPFRSQRVPGTVAPPPPPRRVTRRAVAGLSLSDYVDRKLNDDKHDPMVFRYTGEKIPNGHHPRMTQQPVNVTKGEDGILHVTKYQKEDYARMGTVAVDETPDIYTAAVDKNPRMIWPKYYQNPYQYQDYVYLQDIYANTIAGRIFDVVAFFSLANGIKPRLKIRDESAYKNDEEKRKVLDDHRWMTDILTEIEKGAVQAPLPFGDPVSGGGAGAVEYPVGPIGTAEPGQPALDTPLQKKWFACFINCMVFGRSMMVPRVDPADNVVDVQGEKYAGIPKMHLVIHPRDMGFNFVDHLSHRLLGIQLANSNWIIRPNEMIFWEWMPDNPVYGSKFYGMSAAQSMMGSARTLRRIIEVDFPLIAKTRWSGMYWLVFKRKGEEEDDSDAELRRYLSRVELNGINATLEENPQDDFAVHKIDLDPKIRELNETVRDLVQYMMAQVGMPQGLLYGEDNLNRDTLKSKINSWTRGPLKRYREPFLDTLTVQWYARLGATLAAQDPKWSEALKKVEIVASVDEFSLDSREELISTLAALENITGAWTDTARADYLEMHDLQQRVDPDKGPEDVPGMPSKSMKVQDESGRKYEVSDD